MTSFSVQEFRAGLRQLDEAPLRANAPLAVAIGGAACLAGFILVGPFVSRGIADDAGVMSFLLGEGARRAPAARPVRTAARYEPAMDRYFMPWREQGVARSGPARVAQRQAPHKRPMLARKTPATIITLVTPPPRPVMESRTASLSALTDTTLRRGDAVMTPAGIRIFQGARHYPFAVRDFRPLAFAGNVPHRNALLAIDRVVREPSWSASFKPAWPAAVNAAARSDTRTPVDDGVSAKLVVASRRS